MYFKVVRMARGRPGRPPKWKHGTKNKTFRIPLDLEEKLQSLIRSGKFASEVEAIYFYVMNAGKLDKLVDEITRLKRELEVVRAEGEALRKRVSVLERERDEALEKAREWEEKYRELEARLAEVASGVVSEDKEVEEMKVEDLVSELERTDLGELAREYYRLNQALHKWDGYFVFLGEERLKRSEVEKRVEELRRRINQVLDLRGIPRAAAWKAINDGKFEALKKLEG